VKPLDFQERSPADLVARADAFRADMARRRSVRDFSSRPVERPVIEACLAAAGSAPSGANLQPWYFVVVQDPQVKQRIRVAAETEERAFYEARAPRDWLDALAPLGTDAHKPFLETAPYLIAVFQQRYSTADNGKRVKHYYAAESVGLATGLLIAALHHAGLATLTHTPSPMGFLNRILERPRSERPFLLLVTGYPAPGAQVPEITRKTLGEIATFV
jgi:nitroreductase